MPYFDKLPNYFRLNFPIIHEHLILLSLSLSQMSAKLLEVIGVLVNDCAFRQ